jgi:gag-polypeptide of LTR copia-type
MKNDNNLQAHLKYVQSLKLELEEQGADLLDDLHNRVLLGLVTLAYTILVSILESQKDITLTTIVKHLLDENRKLAKDPGRSEIALLTN